MESASKSTDYHPLAKAKVIYFFYVAISKSLPGYLASYYKHVLLLSPHQVSVLVAARYFAVLFGSPVLGSIADRLNKFRNILVVTLLALLFTYLIVPIVEPIDGFNCKQHLHENTSTISIEPTIQKAFIKSVPKSKLDPIKGHYHGKLMYGLFYSWPFEAWEYEETDSITKKVYITLLVVTLIGEFFASPSETFIDVYTVQRLKTESHRFGLQILPGRFGWMVVSGIFLFIQSTTQKYSKDFCYVGHIVNSTPYLFVIYGMIFICVIVALSLRYNSSRSSRRSPASDKPLSCTDLRHAKCLKALLLVLRTPMYVAFAIAVIFSGFGQGTKTLFVYSYMRDLGGNAVLYFAFLTVNFLSNVIALASSPWLLKKFGHENLMAAGLLANGVTFITYSLIENPSFIMFVEPFDGISSSLSWVAIITYVGCPPHIGAALQGLIHGLYRGLGLAIGYFIVSKFILRFGYLALFIGLGVIYFLCFGGFLTVTFFWPAKCIADEYTNYSIVFQNKEESDMSETEMEIPPVKANG